MMIGDAVWRVGLPLENRTLSSKLKRASTSASLLLYANNAAALPLRNGAPPTRHAQMPRHFPKTLEPVIVRPRTNLISMDPLTACHQIPRPWRLLGTRKREKMPILTSFLGTDGVGGFSRTYINVFLPCREGASTKLSLTGYHW